MEVLSCTEHSMYEQDFQSLRYKLLSVRMPAEGTGFCLLEVIITVHFPSNQELGDFDKESKGCGRLKGKRNERSE